jgi:hypothetical protein
MAAACFLGDWRVDVSLPPATRSAAAGVAGAAARRRRAATRCDARSGRPAASIRTHVLPTCSYYLHVLDLVGSRS